MQSHLPRNTETQSEGRLNTLSICGDIAAFLMVAALAVIVPLLIGAWS